MDAGYINTCAWDKLSWEDETMPENKKGEPAPKTAGNNQWITTHQKPVPDNRERRDGPGGENAQGSTRRP